MYPANVLQAECYQELMSAAMERLTTGFTYRTMR